uniref:Uncharacterized protein n=1 Tax=Oryza glumipatula TaxID=40148 RepID=A0A0E0BEJ6_9ORYZ
MYLKKTTRALVRAHVRLVPSAAAALPIKSPSGTTPQRRGFDLPQKGSYPIAIAPSSANTTGNGPTIVFRTAPARPHEEVSILEHVERWMGSTVARAYYHYKDMPRLGDLDADLLVYIQLYFI